MQRRPGFNYEVYKKIRFKNCFSFQYESVDFYMYFRSIIVALTALICSCTYNTETKTVTPDSIVTGHTNGQQAVEGTINGGGGKGVLCQQQNGSESLETLDLYEGRVLYGLDIEKELTNETDMKDFIVEKVSHHFWNPYTIEMNEYKKILKSNLEKGFYSKIRYLGSGKYLKTVNDSLEPIFENNCRAVQLAVYYNETDLIIDQNLWNKMSWTNKAALLLHETFYFIERQNGAKNSITSRKAVAEAFSTKGLISKTFGVPVNKFLSCSVRKNGYISYANFMAYDSEINMYNQKMNGLEIVFTYLNFQNSFLRTSAFFERLTFENILDKNRKEHRSANLLTNTTNYENMGESKIIIYLMSDGDGKGKINFYNEQNGNLEENLDYHCSVYQK